MNNYTNPYVRLQTYYSWLSSRCSEGHYTGMTILELHKATQIPLNILRQDIAVLVKWNARIRAKFNGTSDIDCAVENRVYFNPDGRKKIGEDDFSLDDPDSLEYMFLSLEIGAFPEELEENSREAERDSDESGKNSEGAKQGSKKSKRDLTELEKIFKRFEAFFNKIEPLILDGSLDEIPLFISNCCYSDFDIALTYDETLALNAVLKDLDPNRTSTRKDPFFFQIKDSYRTIHNYRELADRLQLIEEAIENKTPLFMRYENSKGEILQFDFQPLKISYDENENLYCILSIYRGNIQVHRFDRIRGLWSSKAVVEAGDISMIEKIAPQVWGNCFSEEPEHVKVRFYNEANVWYKVKRDLACRTKGKLYEEDGFLYYEDTVYGVSKFRTWIYGFGSSAIVLEPVSLREHIIESLNERKNRTE